MFSFILIYVFAINLFKEKKIFFFLNVGNRTLKTLDVPEIYIRLCIQSTQSLQSLRLSSLFPEG